MTVRDLIELLENFEPAAQVFVQGEELHDAEVVEYDMHDLPAIVVII